MVVNFPWMVLTPFDVVNVFYIKYYTGDLTLDIFHISFSKRTCLCQRDANLFISHNILPLLLQLPLTLQSLQRHLDSNIGGIRFLIHFSCSLFRWQAARFVLAPEQLASSQTRRHKSLFTAVTWTALGEKKTLADAALCSTLPRQ